MTKAHMADDNAAMIEGTIKAMDQNGVGLEMYVMNVGVHVKNAIEMAEVTLDLQAAGERLVYLARDYSGRYDLMRIYTDEMEKRRNTARLNALREAYQDFRRLIQAGEPSSIARALGD